MDPTDKSESSVTIENPDEPVNLGGYTVADGVPQGGHSDPHPKTDDIYPLNLRSNYGYGHDY